MIACPSCGADNVEGTRFCVKCGTTLPAAPAPESWRQSGDLGQQQQTQQPGYQSGGYAPPTPPQSSYPTYNPPQQQGGYQQPVIGGLGGLLAGLGSALGSILTTDNDNVPAAEPSSQ